MPAPRTPSRPGPSRNAALPYDEALARRVLDRIAKGDMLRDLWRDPSLPTRGDLRRWRQTHPGFDARLRAAVNAARSRRMSTYSHTGAETILGRIAAGESLTGICREPAMPSMMTVMLWLKEHPDFAAAMAIARQVQTEVLLDRGAKIMEAITPQNASAAAVQLAHLRWHAGKVSPQKYGPHKPIDRTQRRTGQVMHVYIKRFTDAPMPGEPTSSSGAAPLGESRDPG